MAFGFRRSTMKLTLKDKDFLERLKPLLDSKGLDIDLQKNGLKRLILRKNYGDRIDYVE